MAKIGVNKTDISNFFDSWYDGGTFPINRGGIESNRLKDVLDSIPLPVRYVLDHGCGQGSWIHLLQDKFPGAKITGIDVSKNGIDLASKLFPTHTFLLFDGETAPLPGNYFDLIFSWQVLDAVWNLDKSLLDISRLLKKGGLLCISMPCANENSFIEKITRLVKEGKEESIDGYKRFFCSYPGRVRSLRSEETIELFSRYSLKIYKEFYSGQFWGAIDYVSKSSYSYLKELFDYKKSVDTNAKIKLCLLRIVFVPLFCVVKLSNVRNIVILNKIKESRNLINKISFSALFILKPISLIFGSILSLFSIIEWRLCNQKKHGSAQFLIFKKE